MGTPARRSIVRFFGPRGDLLVADASRVMVYDATGRERVNVQLDDFIDIAPVGDELWVVRPAHLTRLSGRDGRELGSEPIPHLDLHGRFLLSSTAPQLPVWHAEKPVWLKANPATTEIPGTGGDLILPVSEGRWLLWQTGQLRLWRSVGEAWRRPHGEPGSRPIDGQVLLDGRMFTLVQQRAEGSELKLSVAAVSDGAQTVQMRLQGVTHVVFAARRGIALARAGDRLSVIDLRFGRWIRDMSLPAGTLDVAVDDGLQRLALVTASGVELVRPEALEARTPAEIQVPTAADETDDGTDDAPTNGHSVERSAPVEPIAIESTTAPPEAPAPAETSPGTPSADEDAPLPNVPLVRFDPLTVTPTASAREITQSIELLVQLIGARVGAAIAEGWDSGRISRSDPTKPPFAAEVAGLLGYGGGRAQAELAEATRRLGEVQEIADTMTRARVGRLTPLDVLVRDFKLNEVAHAILVAVVAPRLHGELARLYGILGNDPGRPLVDEHLVAQILGPPLLPYITRELDGDRPLRRFGLIKIGAGERPFAALNLDPLITRYIANQPLEGEPDHHLTVRQFDRDLDELQLPRSLIVRALRFLSAPREQDPVRLVVRGRTGSGRHTLLAALAARAGRALGVIDLSLVPREPGRIGETLEGALRRAMLRGLVPCVDGLDLISSEDPLLKLQIASALRQHPGPIALRLSPDATIPLDPGYLLLDLPARNERQRGESWSIALARHHIELSDAGELASRYRVGPGIIERVCSEVSRRPDRPSDPASWMRELDDAVRQHVENRLGTTASRVTRLASWADMVLPEDIIDSLLELTARVRHRKQVYEQWGFDRSITTARGITALFAGGPGTGKTMVAGVIARDLGLDLYRVDVSRITSKWIGETEKNLGSLFDAAEDGQVMLLFDEADSLFGKRTEVKSSVDRYANMEVNYLLQRLDSFEGIAILTTNFGTAIDPAFKRRLTYRVTFPFPDEEMREQLWRSLIPPQVPITGEIDFASLSHRFRLSGGYIRNAALRAAFLAAEEGSALTQDHLERAIRMEFREIGKLAESGTLE